MATSDDKPKKRESLRRGLDFIFGFENKKGEILDYWIYSADGLSLSAQEFYMTVEQRLAERKIPGMEIGRQEFAEAGLLSDQRLYLRLVRERLAITTCAAPFGKIFFFSCRTVHVPALVRLWHILAALAFLNIMGGLLIPPLGLVYAGIAQLALLFALVGVLRNASAGGRSNLDTILLRIPVIATIYEDWFREETYYREDTRSLYLKLLPALIKELADEAAAAKGFKLEPHLQPIPSLNAFNKPFQPDKVSPAS